ncbi:unnamed protein product [Prunus brigantina]
MQSFTQISPTVEPRVDSVPLSVSIYLLRCLSLSSFAVSEKGQESPKDPLSIQFLFVKKLTLV